MLVLAACLNTAVLQQSLSPAPCPAGIGVPVSLWLRCVSARRRSVGELLAGVHLVQEVRVTHGGEPDDPDTGRQR
jgi:hypothetical protein